MSDQEQNQWEQIVIPDLIYQTRPDLIKLFAEWLNEHAREVKEQYDTRIMGTRVSWLPMLPCFIAPNDKPITPTAPQSLFRICSR